MTAIKPKQNYCLAVLGLFVVISHLDLNVFCCFMYGTIFLTANWDTRTSSLIVEFCPFKNQCDGNMRRPQVNLIKECFYIFKLH